MGPERRALFMCAAHCQGGHSGAGQEAANALGVPFPLDMKNLVLKAKSEGENPAKLWPWLIETGRVLHGGNRYFTPPEIKAATNPTATGDE